MPLAESGFRSGVELRDRDFALDNGMFIFVNDFHFAPLRQRGGAGTAVIRHFLKKGLDVEFVIAKCNEKAWGWCGSSNTPRNTLPKIP